jgi:hypothetical protein
VGAQRVLVCSRFHVLAKHRSMDTLDLSSIKQALETLDAYVREFGVQDGRQEEGCGDGDGSEEEAQTTSQYGAKRSRGDAGSVPFAPHMCTVTNACKVLEVAYQRASDLLWQSDDADALKLLLAECIPSDPNFLHQNAHPARLNQSQLTNYHGQPKGRYGIEEQVACAFPHVTYSPPHSCVQDRFDARCCTWTA